MDRETPLLILLAAVLLWIALSMPGARGPELRADGAPTIAAPAGDVQAQLEQPWADPLILPDRKVAVERAATLRKRPESAPSPVEAVADLHSDRPLLSPVALLFGRAANAVPAIKAAGGIRTTGPPVGSSPQA